MYHTRSMIHRSVNNHNRHAGELLKEWLGSFDSSSVEVQLILYMNRFGSGEADDARNTRLAIRLGLELLIAP